MTTDIIYGLHSVRHALQHSPQSVLEIWVQDNRQSAKDIVRLLETAAGAASVQVVSRQTLDRLSQFGRHQGIAVRMRRGRFSAQDLDTLLLSAATTELPLYLALDGIQDPHNLGACLRTADAAGVTAVILPKDRAVGMTPTVAKVASGALEKVPIVQVTNLARALRQLKDAGAWIVGASGDAEKSIYQTDLNRPLALVLGAEGKGLRENTRKHCDLLAHIPMAGTVASLNVSVAAAVCLYEAVRQRNYISRI
ncbi:MAG: 23S rRNA (guanosine(2251)-2'-O)-methyltransferase RlmB [Gammaproteobacteria bacterium]